MNSQLLADLEKSRLSLQIARRLSKAIQEGRLLPGQQLDPERQLSQSFGVSRPVLREALRALESRGLIVIQHGRGTFIADEPAHLLNVAPRDWFRDNWHHVRHFYDARLLIEPHAAALAAKNVSEENVARLRAILAAADEVISNGEVIASIGLDIDFHSEIAEMAGNAYMSSMLKSVINPDTDLRRVLHRLPGRPSVAHRGHERVFAAIESGDSAKSRDEMATALHKSVADITAYLKGGGVTAEL